VYAQVIVVDAQRDRLIRRLIQGRAAVERGAQLRGSRRGQVPQRQRVSRPGHRHSGIGIQRIIEQVIRVARQVIGAVIGPVPLEADGLRDYADWHPVGRGADLPRGHARGSHAGPGEAVDVLGHVAAHIGLGVEDDQVAGIETTIRRARDLDIHRRAEIRHCELRGIRARQRHARSLQVAVREPVQPALGSPDAQARRIGCGRQAAGGVAFRLPCDIGGRRGKRDAYLDRAV